MSYSSSDWYPVNGSQSNNFVVHFDLILYHSLCAKESLEERGLQSIVVSILDPSFHSCHVFHPSISPKFISCKYCDYFIVFFFFPLHSLQNPYKDSVFFLLRESFSLPFSTEIIHWNSDATEFPHGDIKIPGGFSSIYMSLIFHRLLNSMA